MSHHHFETALLVTISLLDSGFLVTWQEMGKWETINYIHHQNFFNTEKVVNAFSDSTGLPHARRSTFESGKNSGNVCTVNPMHPKISMHNLYPAHFKTTTQRIQSPWMLKLR